MKFEIVVATVRSITIELNNELPFNSENPYDVYVNGHIYSEANTHNVISIFGLEPDHDYKIEVKDLATKEKYGETIRTAVESVILNVKRFGAVGNGVHLDSGAIQAAIMSCPIDGSVYIPEGVYYCTPLFLKSDMTLIIEKGAVLKGHTDRSVYPELPGCTPTCNETDEYYLGTWEGNPLDAFASLITGIGIERTAIIGEGIIDGNAGESDWWEDPKVKRKAWRPRTVFLKGCKEVVLQGVTVRNSPSWTIHPYLSDQLTFVDLRIENHKDSPNTDGLDPESCSGVKIVGVDFSVGDDCIAIKSGKLYMGKKLKRPSEKIVIRNCRMRHGHGAVVIGSEMSGGVKEVLVSRCLFEKTDRGLRIKTRRGRGKDAVIDGIAFNHIKMNEVLSPFVINMFYFCDPDGQTEYVWSKEPLKVDEWTPDLGRFVFEAIECHNCEVSAAYFHGLPEQPIKAIEMRDITIHFKKEALTGRPAMMSFADEVSKQGIFADNIISLKLQNVSIKGFNGAALIANNIEELIED